MSHGISHRIKKALAASSVNQIVNLVSQLALVPIFFHTWGKLLYGDWIALSSLTTYLSMSDLSFASAAANRMTALIANDDYVPAKRILETIAAITVIAATLGMTIFAAIILKMPMVHWFKLDNITEAQAKATVLLLGLQIVIYQFIGVYLAPLRASRQLERALMIQAICKGGVFIVWATVLFCHVMPPVLAASGDAFLLFIMLPATMIQARRRVPNCSSFRVWMDKQMAMEVFKPALAYNAFPLATAFYIQGYVTVITIVAGPAAVAAFQTTRTMTRFVNQVTDAIAGSAWYEMSACMAKDEIDSAKRILRATTSANVWIAAAMCLFLLLCGPPLYHLWTAGKVATTYPVLALMLAAQLVNSVYCSASVVQMSTNRHYALALYQVILGVISLGVCYAATKAYGLVGAAFAVLFYESALAAFVLPVSTKMVRDSVPRLLSNSASPRGFYTMLRRLVAK